MLAQDIADSAANTRLGRLYNSLADEARMPTERLPFTVRLVRNEDDLWKAVRIRHAAYARHLPQFAQSLSIPEKHDTEDGFVVLLAESKVDNTPLGTMRIQTNRFRRLSVQQSVDLPDWMSSRPLAEATRLGVTESRVGRLVTTVLFKAFYLYCLRNGVDWMVVAGRSPIDRQYERLLFSEVFPGMGHIPLEHAGNLPHKILASQVSTAEARWKEAAHPLFDFAFRTNHIDLDVGPRRSWQRQVSSDKVQLIPTVPAKVAVKNL
jgi:hypothetical protein